MLIKLRLISVGFLVLLEFGLVFLFIFFFHINSVGIFSGILIGSLIWICSEIIEEYIKELEKKLKKK